MSDDSIICVANIQDAEISIGQSIFDLKFKLLALAGGIESVNSFEDQESASEVLRKISGLLKSIEDSRKTVKAPVLVIGKKIDELAKTFVCELEVEKDRISKTIGVYAAAEELKRKEAERKAQEEAKTARLAAAALHPEVPAPTIVPVAVVPAPRKVAGTRIITTRRFEIVDLSELHNLHPEFFIPDESKIREFIKGLKDISQPVDGLKVWDETKASAL